MKLGRFNEIDDDSVKQESEYLSENEVESIDFEKDGIGYHIENIEDRFKALFSKSEGDTSYLKRLDSYIEDFDENTAFESADYNDESLKYKDVDDYTEEEIKDIWDNDPGYINEIAFKKLPHKEEIEEVEENEDLQYTLDKNGAYMQMGFHSDYSNYHKDAVEGSEKECRIEKGTVLERWGNERGTYFTEPGTNFSDLNLNQSQDKLDHNLYEVIKPLDEKQVKKSEVKRQPFNENKEQGTAFQYKTIKSAEDLINEGYLKRIDSDEKK